LGVDAFTADITFQIQRSILLDVGYGSRVNS
jgi:hypothetical protein